MAGDVDVARRNRDRHEGQAGRIPCLTMAVSNILDSDDVGGILMSRLLFMVRLICVLLQKSHWPIAGKK